MSATSIAAERRLLAPLGMRTRQQWGATGRYLDKRPVTRPVGAFFLHVAVVADPSDLIGTEDQVMRNIERIGWQRFPATGYPYNAAAFNSGRLMEGQPVSRRGAHTYNDKKRRVCAEPGCPNRGIAFPRGGSEGWNLNYTTLSVCLPQMHTVPVTDEQVEDAARYAAQCIRTGIAVPSARWHGHRCVAWKECPGNPGWRRLPEIQQITDRMVKKPTAQPKPKPAPTSVEDDVTPEDIKAIAKATATATWEHDVRRGPSVWPAHLAVAKPNDTLQVVLDQLSAIAGKVDALAAEVAALKPPAG